MVERQLDGRQKCSQIDRNLVRQIEISWIDRQRGNYIDRKIDR